MQPAPGPISWSPADLANLNISTYDVLVVARAFGINPKEFA